MRATLSFCLALLALAASGCHATAAPRAASRAPIEATAATAPERVSEAPVVTPERASAQAIAVSAPSTVLLASPRVAAEVEPPADTADDEVHGTIVARQGSSLTIRLDDDTPIATGERAQLLRHFERRLGSATVTGWLDVARVTVLARDGRSFDLSIDEETARVMVNGRKQDQFRVGFRVRLQAT